MIRFFGSGEMSLRLVPLLAGIASLFMFTALAKRLLTPAAVPIAVGFFVLSGPLIYYSSEAKQYSTDVAIALGLFLIASTALKGGGRLRVVGMTIAAGLSIWFSQPAVFVVAGIGLAWLWVAAREHDRSALIRVAIFGVVASCSFILSYLTSLRYLVRDHLLMEYWNGAFVPMPPFSLSAIWWYINRWIEMCENPVGLTFVGLATLAAAIGIREMFREDRQSLLMLILPVFFALVASGLHRYPFRGRLLLFAVPSLLLIIAYGLAAIRSKTRGIVPELSVLLIGLLFFQPLVEAIHNLLKPRGVEEIRPALEYIEKHRASGDVLYCYYAAEPALKYYSYRETIRRMTTITGISSRGDWTGYRKDLDQLRGGSRVWFIFSHDYRDDGVDEERLFLDYLDGMGKRNDGFHAVGASAYLYDLRTRE